MKNLLTFRSLSLGCAALVAALALSAPAMAQHGGGGGGHAGGGAHAYGGGHAGGYGGYRGGYGGYRGGYGGYRGGYGYYRGGYGWGSWGWGWGGGLGLGLYFATLPYYYSTYYWGGVPYYYADDTYYRWDGASRQYLTVAPPPEVQSQAAGDVGGIADLMVYPKNGQSPDQQGKDKFECHRWAAEQAGFDPSLGSPSGTAPPPAESSAAPVAGGGGVMTSNPGKRSDYFRAQAACLEGRGYSVK